MKRLILVLAMLTTITGCSQEADRWEIEAVMKACTGHGGIHSIRVFALSSINAACLDGYRVVLPGRAEDLKQ